MNDRATDSRGQRPQGYYPFTIALAIGTILGALGIYLLETWGFTDFFKNWP